MFEPVGYRDSPPPRLTMEHENTPGGQPPSDPSNHRPRRRWLVRVVLAVLLIGVGGAGGFAIAKVGSSAARLSEATPSATSLSSPTPDKECFAAAELLLTISSSLEEINAGSDDSLRAALKALGDLSILKIRLEGITPPDSLRFAYDLLVEAVDQRLDATESLVSLFQNYPSASFAQRNDVLKAIAVEVGLLDQFNAELASFSPCQPG
jgi:hypothetical protein